MSIIKFPTKKLIKKRVIYAIALGILVLLFIVLWLFYKFNNDFRAFFDINIFKKEINSDSLYTINIDSDEDQFYYAYDKYITILNKNVLYVYNSTGQVVQKTDLNINLPIFCSNNKFLAIAENNGNSVALISGTNVLWEKTLDGNISKISVNKNGYVSLVLSGSSYKSIVVSFDNKGNELFRTYISKNIAIATDISNDNKYLSVAEIDYSGSIIKSMVKNISIEKAKSDPANSIVYTYQLKENTLITNIKFKDRNKVLCMCNNAIYSLDLSDFSDIELLSFDNNTIFSDVNLKNSFLYTTSTSKGITNISLINIYNLSNDSISKYEIKGSIKSIFTHNDKIAINSGNETYFVGLNGWLIKKFDSYSEINNIIIGDSIAGIIYKNKINVIEI